MNQQDAADQQLPRRARGSVACRRCRRLRIKCIRDETTVSCKACVASNAVCETPRKGDLDVSREWRSTTRPRIRSHSRTTSEQNLGSTQTSGMLDVWHEADLQGSRSVRQAGMPTQNEIIESCRIFMTSYFQLGFIHKPMFLEGIANHDVSEFLILCILCLSARFTPCMINRFGGQAQATDFFHQKALEMVPQKMYRPSLENTQGFFLLSIAEWGNNDRERSSVHMGVAVRLAAMLKLHREETYSLKEKASEEERINAEMGRRTFWMIQSQDNLHSGFNYPAPFAASDISALLPCNEQDFLFGVTPSERAALAGTQPAIANLSLTSSPRRSLFATLIQAHSLWGRVARRACSPAQSAAMEQVFPSSTNPEYQDVIDDLLAFEMHLPPQQKWSKRNLRVWKDLGFDLAYLSVVMMLRLSNIIIRRIHLDDMKTCLADPSVDGTVRNFWENIANDLFQNVEELYEQIDASFASRSRTEVQAYPAILVLPVYVCGSLALNLWKSPELCPKLANGAEKMLTSCLRLISELQHAWPLARQWRQGLQQAATPLSSGPSPQPACSVFETPSLQDGANLTRPIGNVTEAADDPIDLVLNAPFENMDQPPSTRVDPTSSFAMLPSDMFDAEVDAFLQGDPHYTYWDAGD